MTIVALEDQIRDRINARRKQNELISRGADWNKLCSALDVIGDTELGLTAYLEHPAIEEPGLCYLHVYGALQLLQTQQDAVEQVCRTLGLRPKASPKIPEVREVRSSAVAHPTAQQEDNATKSNFIVRSSLSQYGGHVPRRGVSPHAGWVEAELLSTGLQEAERVQYRSGIGVLRAADIGAVGTIRRSAPAAGRRRVG